MAIVIFDLDGTLALIEHRRHHVTNGAHNWPQFFKDCVDDQPNRPIIAACHALAQWHAIWIWSGRSDEVMAETIQWLKQYGIVYNRLQMRHKGDHTPDVDLKRGWLHALQRNMRQDILCVFDDRQRLVDMWREEGLTCLQVAEGDF